MNKISFLLLLMLILESCGPSEQQIQKAIKETNVAVAGITANAPTSTAQFTDTPQPTTTPTTTPTPQPTATLPPTNTPVNTSTPTIAPTETPGLKPIIVSGNSDQVIDIPEDYQYSFVDFIYKGNTNFIVQVLDNTNESIDALVNAIGNYSGRRSLGFFHRDTPHRLQVKTQGEWIVTINPIERAYFHICEIPGGCSGKGDDAVLFSARPDLGVFIHKGESNFVVRAAADRSETLINEIGSYSGKVVFPPETRFVEIIADGEWEMVVTAR